MSHRPYPIWRKPNGSEPDSRKDSPPDYSYLLVEGVDRLLTFLPEAFGAQVLARETRPDSAIMHAEVRIGDSMLMMGEASADFGPMPASIYLYVTDCDAVSPARTGSRRHFSLCGHGFALGRALRRGKGSVREHLT